MSKVMMAVVGVALLLCRLGDGEEPSVRERLVAADRREREAAAREIVEARAKENRAYVEAAKALLSGKQRRDAEQIVRVLGELRAEEAIPLLIAELEFDPFARDDGLPTIAVAGALTWEARRPCAAALVKLGVSGLRPLLSEVGNTDRDAYVREASRVIEKVLGAPGGAVFVSATIEGEPDEGRQVRMRRLLRTLSGS